MLGDAAELFAITLLEAHGYTAKQLRNNYPTYDIAVDGSCQFLISVKASSSKQHVRLGTRASAGRLEPDGFVFAFMPPDDRDNLILAEGGYKLLIVPGDVARDDSIALQRSYLAERGKDPDSIYYSLMVKGYSRRQHQRDVWARWLRYENAWDLLPQAR